jgi:hypothetical protein
MIIRTDYPHILEKRMKTVTLLCDTCNEEFEKRKGEYNRKVRLGKTKFYCSRSCHGKNKDNVKHIIANRSNFPVWELNDNKKDEYSKFKPAMRKAKQRSKTFDLTLEHLKDLWEKQQGRCPFTGFDLELRTYQSEDPPLGIRSASLDRIDNDKGYVEGNVRWVSVMFNYARNIFSDQDVIEFAKAVTNGDVPVSTGNTG